MTSSSDQGVHNDFDYKPCLNVVDPPECGLDCVPTQGEVVFRSDITGSKTAASSKVYFIYLLVFLVEALMPP